MKKIMYAIMASLSIMLSIPFVIIHFLSYINDRMLFWTICSVNKNLEKVKECSDKG